MTDGTIFLEEVKEKLNSRIHALQQDLEEGEKDIAQKNQK